MKYSQIKLLINSVRLFSTHSTLFIISLNNQYFLIYDNFEVVKGGQSHDKKA